MRSETELFTLDRHPVQISRFGQTLAGQRKEDIR